MKKSRRHSPRAILRLRDLEHAKSAVPNKSRVSGITALLILRIRDPNLRLLVLLRTSTDP
jgi:hypothetical protein